MSYARFSAESSVYVWGGVAEDGRPLWFCDCCLLSPGHQAAIFAGLDELRAHLKDHRRAGHRVPDAAFAQIARELQQARQAASHRRRQAASHRRRQADRKAPGGRRRRASPSGA